MFLQRTLFFSMVLFFGFAGFAQQAKMKSAPKHPKATSASHKKDSITVVLLPEFIHPGKVVKKDTDYTYEYYDFREKQINLDTLHNADDIEEVLYLLGYYDMRSGSGNGIIGPPYMNAKLKTYKKIDPTTWLSRDFEKKTKSQLEEYKDKITRIDTASSINKFTGTRYLRIRKYYYVKETFSGPDTPHDHEHGKGHGH